MIVSLVLFHKPGCMLDEGKPVTAVQLTDLGAYLQEHLEKTARVVQQLADDGWDCTVALYDVVCAAPDSLARVDVEAKLRQLGLDPEDVILDEDE